MAYAGLEYSQALEERAEYETPSRYTSGKDTITVSIEVNRGDQNPWTEYHYWIYCYQDR